MATSTTAARRYAEALFAAARDGDMLDQIEKDLATIEGLLRLEPQVLEVMRNPLIPAERKQAILQGIFRDTISPVSLRFLGLLVEKRRSDVLPQVPPLFTEMANAFRGILPAYVSTAMPLTPAQEQTLTARLAALTGKTIVLHTEVRSDLVGGLRVRIGDTVLDGSVVGYLRQLRERLRETLVR